MARQAKVASGNVPTSVHLSDQDRRDLKKLNRIKYHNALGFTAVLRAEGMAAVRQEIERLTKEKEGA